MNNAHPIARMSKPMMSDEKAQRFATLFVLNCVADTERTEDVDNALAMYNFANSVLDSVGNEVVTAAATELMDVAHERLEYLGSRVMR